jgi:hypothetical protein
LTRVKLGSGVLHLISTGHSQNLHIPALSFKRPYNNIPVFDQGGRIMKKTWIVIALLGVAVSALGAAGLAYAQSSTPLSGYGSGVTRMGPGGRGPGMGGPGGEEGPLHEVMITSLAESLGLDPDELEDRHEAGETLWQIAQEQGFSVEQARDMMAQARAEALTAAVEEGLMTQEQADWMLSRHGGYGPGLAAGTCDGSGSAVGGFRQGRMGGFARGFSPGNP